jgi:hypothetical protein
MRHARRGLTVIELVLILVAIGLLAFFLLRMRSRDEPLPPSAADSVLTRPAAPGTATALTPTLTLVAPLDSAAAGGATLDVRVRAARGAEPAANAVVRFAVEGGGRVEPDSAITGADGAVAVRWTLGDSGEQTLRATTEGAAAPLTATVRVGGGAGGR